MKIGYARVSTEDQDLSLQIDALKQAGCEAIYQEKVSATKKNRPELQAMLKQLRKGDTVMVWRLDRLCRSVKDLIDIVSRFERDGINFVSITDNITCNDTSSTGKLVFHIFAAFAEFERNLISERTKAGLAAARKKGRKGGRPKGMTRAAKIKAAAAAELYRKDELSITEICKELDIARSTLYRYLRLHKVVPETQ